MNSDNDKSFHEKNVSRGWTRQMASKKNYIRDEATHANMTGTHKTTNSIDDGKWSNDYIKSSTRINRSPLLSIMKKTTNPTNKDNGHNQQWGGADENMRITRKREASPANLFVTPQFTICYPANQMLKAEGGLWKCTSNFPAECKEKVKTPMKSETNNCRPFWRIKIFTFRNKNHSQWKSIKTHFSNNYSQWVRAQNFQNVEYKQANRNI